MSSLDAYIGNADPNGNLTDNSRCVDFAVLDSAEIEAVKELDAHIISLDAVDTNISEFVKTFYYGDKNTFNMNKLAADDNDLMSFDKQHIHKNEFLLPESILRLYGLDLGVELDCVDPCSALEVNKQLLYYKSLANMCAVKCSLTFNEIIETIINRTDGVRALNGSYAVSGTDDGWEDVFGKADVFAPGSTTASITGESVFHQLIISARFKNANPAINDVYVRFRYNVEFRGESWVKSIANNVRPLADGSGNDANEYY